MGYKPSLDRCVVCNRKALKSFKFNIDIGGIVCSNCLSSQPYCEYMDINMYKAMKVLLYTPLDKVYAIKIPKDTTFKLHEIMAKYILNKIERKGFNSLNMLKSMKNNGGI